MKLMNSPLALVILLAFWAIVALPIAGPIIVAALGQRFSRSVRMSLLLTGCLTAAYAYYLYRIAFGTTWIYRGICVLGIPASEYAVAFYCGVVLVSLAKLYDWRLNRCHLDRLSLILLGTVLTLCLVVGIYHGPKLLNPSCGVEVGVIFKAI
jgi:hypothetical protein